MPGKRGKAGSGRSSRRGQSKQLHRAGIPWVEPPQVSQPHLQDLQFIVSGILSNENTINEQRASIAAEAHQAIHRTIHNHRIMANEQGASLFEWMEQLREELREVRAELHDVKTELHDVKTELHDVKKQLSEVRESLINVRERNYLTFLRDNVTEFNKTHKNRIYILNSSEVHGGDALLDASMFLSRRDDFPEERRLFQVIYGLSAEKLQELRPEAHPSILRVLNTVGSAHLSGKMALRAENLQITFDRVVELVKTGEIEEAERVASALSPDDFSYQCDE